MPQRPASIPDENRCKYKTLMFETPFHIHYLVNNPRPPPADSSQYIYCTIINKFPSGTPKSFPEYSYTLSLFWLIKYTFYLCIYYYNPIK